MAMKYYKLNPITNRPEKEISVIDAQSLRSNEYIKIEDMSQYIEELASDIVTVIFSVKGEPMTELDPFTNEIILTAKATKKLEFYRKLLVIKFNQYDIHRN